MISVGDFFYLYVYLANFPDFFVSGESVCWEKWWESKRRMLHKLWMSVEGKLYLSAWKLQWKFVEDVDLTHTEFFGGGKEDATISLLSGKIFVTMCARGKTFGIGYIYIGNISCKRGNFHCWVREYFPHPAVALSSSSWEGVKELNLVFSVVSIFSQECWLIYSLYM